MLLPLCLVKMGGLNELAKLGAASTQRMLDIINKGLDRLPNKSKHSLRTPLLPDPLAKFRREAILPARGSYDYRRDHTSATTRSIMHYLTPMIGPPRDFACGGGVRDSPVSGPFASDANLSAKWYPPGSRPSHACEADSGHATASR